jgi:hypothetical protein
MGGVVVIEYGRVIQLRAGDGAGVRLGDGINTAILSE